MNLFSVLCWNINNGGFRTQSYNINIACSSEFVLRQTSMLFCSRFIRLDAVGELFIGEIWTLPLSDERRVCTARSRFLRPLCVQCCVPGLFGRLPWRVILRQELALPLSDERRVDTAFNSSVMCQ